MAEIIPFPEPAEPVPFQRVGLGYTYDVARVHISVDYLKRRSDGLHGTLTVDTQQGGHVHEADHNFGSLAARVSLAKHLTARMEGPPWGDILETFCVSVMRRERQGAPMLDMASYKDRPREPDAIERLVPWHAETWLFGEGGSCKGLIATAMAVCVATGTDFLGLKVRQGNVAYLDWEDDQDEMGYRLACICRGFGISVPTFYWRNCRRGGALKNQVNQIAKEFTERDISYYVVDSVGLAAGSGNEHTPAETSALELFEALGVLGGTPVCIDHVAKSGIRDKNAPPQIYGSIYKNNLCRYSWEVKKQQEDEADEAHVALTHRKTNRSKKWPPVGVRVAFEDGGRIVRFDREEAQAVALPDDTGVSLKRRMISYLEVAREAVHPGDLANYLGVPLPHIRAELSRNKTAFLRDPRNPELVTLGYHETPA